MEIKGISSRTITWFVLFSVVAALALARQFLIPIALAVFVAFVLAPAVRRLVRMGIARVPATLITMAGVGSVFAGVGWMLVAQMRGFAEKLPDYRANLREKAADVRATLGNRMEEATTTLRDLGQDLADPSQPPAPDLPAQAHTADGIAALLQDVLSSIAGISIVAAFVFLLATVMLMRWEDLRDRVMVLAGESDLAVTTRAGQEASLKISSFLRRQLLINAIHGTTVGAILWIIGVPNPIMWGLLAGVLRFIPYLGPIIGTLAPILVSLASSQGWSQTWITASALLLLEFVTNNVVEPWVYGQCTGISPLALLTAAAFWTWIWGPAGLLLSTPLTVCLIVVGKYVPRMRFFDVLFGDEPAMSTGSRLYQRLLANDADEAWDILRSEAARTSPLTAADQVLLPALGRVASTRGNGRVEFDGREMIGPIAHGIVDEWSDLIPATANAAAVNGPRILCIGARDTFDAVGARVLTLECKRRGLDALYSSQERLLSEVAVMMQKDEIDAIFVSSVLPTHFLHIRSLCKRLLAIESHAAVVVGLWGETGTSEELSQRLPASPRLHVVTSLEQALTWAATADSHSKAHRPELAASI